MLKRNVELRVALTDADEILEEFRAEVRAAVADSREHRARRVIAREQRHDWRDIRRAP
jgi:hypothetical protein